MTSAVKDNYTRTVLDPQWDLLKSTEVVGDLLTFGSNRLEVPHDWDVVDWKQELNPDYCLDLVKDDWPWEEVAVIHCVSMLCHWTEAQVKEVLKRCWDALIPRGVLWVGECPRPTHQAALSSWEENEAKGAVREAGFAVETVLDQILVTGKINVRGLPIMFALKCVKCDE